MYNSGILTTRAMEGYNGITRNVAIPSQLTINRQAAQRDIESIAAQNGITVDAVITRMLKQQDTQETLIQYVRARHERPQTDPVKLGFQAAMILFTDVATLAKSLSLSDSEAMIEIENAENDAINNANPDAGILPVDVRAMLVTLVDEFINRSRAAGLPDSTPALFASVKAVTGDSYNASASTLLAAIESPLYNTWSPDESYEDYEGGGTDYSNSSSTGDGSVFNTTTKSSSSSGSSWIDSVFGYINKAVDTVKNASGAIRDASGNVNAAGGTVNDFINKIGGGVGANAINNSNLPLIIGAGFALVIVVIIIIYANKNN